MSQFISTEQMYIMIEKAEALKARLTSLHENYEDSSDERKDKLNSIILDSKSLYSNIMTKSTTL